MIEHGLHVDGARGDVSSVSLTLRQLVGKAPGKSSKKGVEHSLFKLSQYALASADITRLLEKGVTIISEALPHAYVMVSELCKEDAPFCIRAISGHDSTTAMSARSPSLHTKEFSEAGERVIKISGKYKPFGSLIISEKDRRLTDDELQFLHAAADVLAIAIDRIQVQQATSKSEEMEKQHLEVCIQERSEELAAINERLAQSIEQYKKTEAALRQSEKDLRALSAQLIEVGEQERKRIAGELHDGISQMITSIKFRLENALVQFERGGIREGVTTVTNVIPVIQQTMQEVRRISMDLRPSMLDDVGILSTIEWYCKEYQSTYQGIRVVKTIKAQESSIAENLKLVIFRVIQEALHNVAQHSNANVVNLELVLTGEDLQLRISDNGNGFSRSQQLANKPGMRGLGLRSMRERVEQTTGIFTIFSRPGMGATIGAVWPLQAPASLGDETLLHRVQG